MKERKKIKMKSDTIAEKLGVSTNKALEIRESCATFLLNHDDHETVIRLILAETWTNREKLYAAFYFGNLLEFIEADPFVQLILNFQDNLSKSEEDVYTASFGGMNEVLDVESGRGYRIFASCINYIKSSECKSEVIKRIEESVWRFAEKILGCFCIGRLFGLMQTDPDKVSHII